MLVNNKKLSVGFEANGYSYYRLQLLDNQELSFKKIMIRIRGNENSENFLFTCGNE